MATHIGNKSIYIYIYISRDLMQESMKFCHVAYSMKKIEIPLSHIRDKNKFKSSDPLFHLVQCFKTIFVILFIQYFKTTICFIWFNVSRLFISHTHKKTLCISIHHFHFYSFIYTCPQPFIPIVVSFDRNPYEQAITKEKGLRFLFRDSSLRF